MEGWKQMVQGSVDAEFTPGGQSSRFAKLREKCPGEEASQDVFLNDRCRPGSNQGNH